MPTSSVSCDGCGQPASAEHTPRRLQRLEWATRYRPVHIATLLLGAMSPQSDAEFLYAGKFEGEAARVLEAAGIAYAGKPAEAVLGEFQRGGFFLAYVLECPLDDTGGGADSVEGLLERRIGAVQARIRRSLKPKRVVPMSGQVTQVTARLTSEELGCAVILDGGKPFELDASVPGGAAARLRDLLAGATVTR